MKTDDSGGTSAANDPTQTGEAGELEQRLARRFAVELDRAERDYPALRRSSRDAANPDGAVTRSGRSTLTWRRMALPVTAVAVLLAVSLVGVGLAFRPNAAGPMPHSSSEPSVSPAGPPSSDGIPNQIDGQRVYRIADSAEWQNLSGSFLLGAYVEQFALPCAPPMATRAPAEGKLFPVCDDPLWLAPKAGQSYDASALLHPAPNGAGALAAWADGPAVVIRAHTHDAAAADCTAADKSVCEAAVVVEAVVWPTVPTEINGERVYRASDQASFAGLTGSFLLGGAFEEPQFTLPCAMRANLSNAEQQLIPYCYVQSIDGLPAAPMSNIDSARGQIVVARVHVNDPLAAQCPASDRADCEAAIVVEAVVWLGDQPAATAAATATASGSTATNSASSEAAGPAGASASARSAPPSPVGAPSAVTTDTTTTPPYSPTPS
jgi:hypothetical protein